MNDRLCGLAALARQPVLGVCGFSGAGKTTLLEAVIRQLARRGLKVAAIKHDAHGLVVDRPGKDSDRLFAAGADVRVSGPGEIVWRERPASGNDLAFACRRLLAGHDVVLVEGHKSTPLDTVWLASPEAPLPPADVSGVLEVLAWDEDRPRRMLDLLDRFLPQRWRLRPLRGGVLLGGASRRMGRPKQHLQVEGRPLASIAAQALAAADCAPVLLGAGDAPPSLASLPRLADVAGATGPLAGLAAALRWDPQAAWVVAACDLPLLRPEAVRWLLEQRAPGRWVILPRAADGRLQPLLAVYEPPAGPMLEALLDAGEMAVRRLEGEPGVVTPDLPEELGAAWTNVNRPADLDRLGLRWS